MTMLGRTHVQMETTMQSLFLMALVAMGLSTALSPTLAADGNVARGQRAFNACAQCHSLEPNRSMTGPSLAELWNRKAGSLASFPRYSPALQSSDVVWNDRTLDEWIKDPQHVVPGNQMTFPGVKDAQQRADLLAFLKQATQPGRAPPPRSAQQNGQMGGMMGGGGDPNLKSLDPEKRVQAIGYCRDTYRITTADGKTHAFWERNLRFKTDASENGPQKGAPALVGAGMMGDRADAIFAAPEEMSGFIKPEC
jgi:cytochrome c